MAIADYSGFEGSISPWAPRPATTPTASTPGTTPAITQWLVMNNGVPGMNSTLYANDPAYKYAWDRATAEHQATFGQGYNNTSNAGVIQSALQRYYSQYKPATTPPPAGGGTRPPPVNPGTTPLPANPNPWNPPAPPGTTGGPFTSGYNNYQSNYAGTNVQINPNELTSTNLTRLLDEDSAYIEQARRQGLQYAQSRGMLNSSIAAGSAQAAATQAALPIASADAAVYNTAANAARQLGYDITRQGEAANIQEWLSTNQFSREFNATIATLPYTSATQLQNYLMQAAIDDPFLYTPEVVSGLSNFFNQNIQDLFSRYWTASNATGGNATA